MNNQRPRDLRNTCVFNDDAPQAAMANDPWPAPDDVLIRPCIGNESHIYPMEEWVSDHYDRLTYYALQYHDIAQDVTKHWLWHLKDEADNYILVIGFLYRHAIELRLKSLMSMTPRFRKLSDNEKRKAMMDHSVIGLWNGVKPDLSDEAKHKDTATIERLIGQLDDLDARSDGFRYPFTIPKGGVPTNTVRTLSYASADNLVWVLEALYEWLTAAEDSLDTEMQFLAEIENYQVE